MARGFDFKFPVDARNPTDQDDPPPSGWYTDIDTKDYRVALFSVPSLLFMECVEWEKRELARHEALSQQAVAR